MLGDSERRKLSSEFSTLNISGEELSSDNSDTVTSGISFTVKKSEDNSDADPDSVWTVVKNTKDYKPPQKKHLTVNGSAYNNNRPTYSQKLTNKGYFRSQSDHSFRRETDSRRFKNNYSEGDRYYYANRGRGYQEGRGRGTQEGRGRGVQESRGRGNPTRGRGRGNPQNHNRGFHQR